MISPTKRNGRGLPLARSAVNNGGMGSRRPTRQHTLLTVAVLVFLSFLAGYYVHGTFFSSDTLSSSSSVSFQSPRERVMLSQIKNLQQRLVEKDTEVFASLKRLAGVTRSLEEEQKSSLQRQQLPILAASETRPAPFLHRELVGAAPKEVVDNKRAVSSVVKSEPPETVTSSDGCRFTAAQAGYLAECTRDPCHKHGTLDKALASCAQQTECNGVVATSESLRGQVVRLYELRAGSTVLPSPEGVQEVSYVRLCGAPGGGGGQSATKEVEKKEKGEATEKKRKAGNKEEEEEDMEGGLWSVGNVEKRAGMVVVHGRDPLPEWYDPATDGFTPSLDSVVSSAAVSLAGGSTGARGGSNDEGEKAVKGGASWSDMGSFVNGMPTIYLKVASYRDELCHLTLADAFEKAKHPDRIFVGVVEQNAAGDVPCLQVDGGEGFSECPGDSGEVHQPTLCKYASHVRVYKQHARDATGPTFARHVGDRMYRGEYFVLQTDAHMTFVAGWDLDITAQFDATGNDMAVLSTYPTEVVGSLDAQGKSKRHTSPVMCATGFTAEGLLRHGSAIEIYPMFGASAVLEPFWAAGFSFARGHFAVRVPYDCCTSMLFQGEEIDIAVRAWTEGYDLYTPHNSVAFHPYSRKKRPPMFWENNDLHKGDGLKAARRVQSLIHLGNPSASSFDGTDAHRYGTGNARSADDFYALFGVDRNTRKITKDLCRWSTSGRMHKQLSAFLRPNGQGIDYSKAFSALGRPGSIK